MMIYILILVFMDKQLDTKMYFSNLKDCEIKAIEFTEDNRMNKSKFICVKDYI